MLFNSIFQCKYKGKISHWNYNMQFIAHTNIRVFFLPNAEDYVQNQLHCFFFILLLYRYIFYRHSLPSEKTKRKKNNGLPYVCLSLCVIISFLFPLGNLRDSKSKKGCDRVPWLFVSRMPLPSFCLKFLSQRKTWLLWPLNTPANSMECA